MFYENDSIAWREHVKMGNEDLSKLKIDKSVRTFQPVKRKKFVYFIVAVLIIIVAAFLYLNGFISPAVPGNNQHLKGLPLPGHLPVKCEWLCRGPAKSCCGIQDHRSTCVTDGGRREPGKRRAGDCPSGK